MSSSASSGTGNRRISVNGNGAKESLKKRMKTSKNWRMFLLTACVLALAIDPLFLFIPQIDSKKTCIGFDKNLGITACFRRTYIDTFYVIYVIYCFIKEVIVYLDRSQKPSRDESSVDSKAVRKRRIPLYFLIVGIVSVLPIPQVVVLRLIVQSSTSLVSKRRLISFKKWIIVCQYIPRIIRIYPLYKKVTKTSGTIAEKSWIGAVLNLFVFFLCSYAFGAFWYVNGVEKRSRCWLDACRNLTALGCDLTTDLFCAKDINNYRFLKNSCPLIDPEKITELITESITNSSINSSNVYDFGMYVEVLKSRVVEVKPRDFPRKFVYCFWWGLKHLCTFGQGLKPGNYATDIFFAIIICASGLFLFAVLIGNVQKYMITTTVRVEEMKERKRDTEKWMSSRALPKELKKRIRKFDKYKWRAFRGTEDDYLLRSLPKDLRFETKRHLYKNLLKRVPFLENMNDWLLEALCDRVKSVFYSANSCILREGDPVEEMLIVTKGKLKCSTKANEVADHYETSELKVGDVCGDLHFLILNPSPSPHLLTSNKTVMTHTNVEGFILLPDDLKFVASHLDLNVQCSSSSEPQKSAVPEISKDET